MFRSFILLLGLLFSLKSLHARSQSTDSARVFTFDNYLSIVSLNHPLAKAADLRTDAARAAMLRARGGFDPKIYTEVYEKNFKETEYYRLLDAGLKVPTWLGLDLKAGFESNRGQFLDPQNDTSTDGLLFAGVTLPIGKGLFIDKRRADLRKARLAQGLNEAERLSLINELLFEAGDAYWSWFSAYNNMKVFENALGLAQNRRQFVKRGAELGNFPSIDTLEAGIQVQNRFLSYEQAKLDFLNATAQLSVFLWVDGEIPMEIGEDLFPQTFDLLDSFVADQQIQMNLDTLVQNHPMLVRTEFKIDQMKVERRLLKEDLKPVLNLNYTPISEPVGNNIFADFQAENYTFGLEFSFPILLRKERGNVKLASIGIRNAEFDLQNKRQELVFKSQAALNEWQTTKIQADQYQQTVVDYQSLLRGEQRKFDAGESSLFLVNSREVGFIQAQTKLIEILAKNQLARIKTYYSLGLLGQEGTLTDQL